MGMQFPCLRALAAIAFSTIALAGNGEQSLPGAYRCSTERIVVSNCGDRCLVMFPDRPKRNGLTVQATEDPTVLAERLRSCSVEPQLQAAGRGAATPRAQDPIPPGKRLEGTFAQRDGLSVHFGPWVAQLDCSEAYGAYPYSVSEESGRETVLIKAVPDPIKLVRRADGSFAGPAAVTVTLKRSASTSVTSLTPSWDAGGQAVSSGAGAMRSTRSSVPSQVDATVRCAASQLKPDLAK